MTVSDSGASLRSTLLRSRSSSIDKRQYRTTEPTFPLRINPAAPHDQIVRGLTLAYAAASRSFNQRIAFTLSITCTHTAEPTGPDAMRMLAAIRRDLRRTSWKCPKKANRVKQRDSPALPGFLNSHKTNWTLGNCARALNTACTRSLSDSEDRASGLR